MKTEDTISIQPTAQQVESSGTERHKEEVWRYGGCQACMGSPCPIRAKIENGKIVKIEGQMLPGLDGKICAKGLASIDQIYSPDRLRYPMRRVGKKGEGKFERITWDEALSDIAAVLRKYKNDGHPDYVHLAYGCGRIGNIPLLHYFSQVYGTPNFSHHHGDSCNASGSAAASITGAAGKPDYANAKYILEVSHNPLGGGTANAHFSVGAFHEAMRKGTKIVVVDPRLSETAALPGADWIPIKPGTDGAFFLGLIHVLISDKRYDECFLQTYTNAPVLIDSDGSPLQNEKNEFFVWDPSSGGATELKNCTQPSLLGSYKVSVGGRRRNCKTAFQQLVDRAARYSPEAVSEITDIPSAKIKEIATDMAAAKPAVATNWNPPRSCFYTNSMQTWRLRHILAMLLGSFDVPGGMMFAELNNIVNYRLGYPKEMPAIFPLAPPPTEPVGPAALPSIELDTDRFKHPFAIAIPKFTRRGILEEKPYPTKAMIVYGNSLLNSPTHTQEYQRAIEKDDLFLVAIDIWRNDHIDYADIVLPDACSLERLEVFTEQWGNHLKVVNALLPVVEPVDEARDVADIFIGLAEKLDFKAHFKFTKEEWFDAQLKPLGIDRRDLEKNGAYYQQSDPLYYRFPYRIKPKTPTGRLEIFATHSSILDLYQKTRDPHADPLPDHLPLTIGKPSAENEFYLLSAKCAITETASSQDNVYLMEEHIDGLGLTCLWINKKKAFKLGLKDGKTVRIWSESTGAEGRVRIKAYEGIHPDAVFAFVGFGHKSKTMTVARGKEGINVNEFIPDHMEWVSGAAAVQEALGKIARIQ